MASDSRSSARSNQATNSAGDGGEIIGPRFRTAFKGTSASSASPTSRSSPPSRSSDEPSNKLDIFESVLDSTDVDSTPHELSSNPRSQDYFGPLQYTPGELFWPVVLLIFSALLLYCISMFTMVLASICGIGLIQLNKVCMMFLSDL
jgi:hypothetical protein